MLESTISTYQVTHVRESMNPDQPHQPESVDSSNISGPTPVTPSAAPVLEPVYVGNTNIIDRSKEQPIAPVVSIPEPQSYNSQMSTPAYQAASSSLNEIIVLLCGIASSTSYILILYFVKNAWVTAIVSTLIALVALFFAIKDYRKSSKLTPLSVVGISAATITLIYVANYLVALAVINSAVSAYNY